MAAARSAAATPEERRRDPRWALSPKNMENNASVANFSRVFSAIAAGCAAGILGFSGWAGLLFCVLALAANTGLLLLKTGGAVEQYFESARALAFVSLMPGVMTFVLFWTLSYNIVHVF